MRRRKKQIRPNETIEEEKTPRSEDERPKESSSQSVTADGARGAVVGGLIGGAGGAAVGGTFGLIRGALQEDDEDEKY